MYEYSRHFEIIKIAVLETGWRESRVLLLGSEMYKFLYKNLFILIIA